MILFLNFAPIGFMGGAEKWMNETAKQISKYEKTRLVSVNSAIASIYSRIVLKRKFDLRSAPENIHQNLSLTFLSFIPFTSDWKKAKAFFKEARLIYFRYELPEFLILFYFLGRSGFKRSIAGLHSPFLYCQPETFFEKLHNAVYSSFLSRKILSCLERVHVLNKRDFNLLSSSYHLENTVYVPNGMDTQTNISGIKEDFKLHILYVGELSLRKGIDRLIDVINHSPDSFLFTIAGDGPLQSEIKLLTRQNNRCNYKGFVGKKDLAKFYQTNEVLFLPSRAESMPLSVLEALSYGLTIVNSPETSLHLPKNVEYSSIDNSVDSYINILSKIYSDKKNHRLHPTQNKQFFDQNLSSQVITPRLYKNVFHLAI